MWRSLIIAFAATTSSALAEPVLNCLGKDARWVFDDDLMGRSFSVTNVAGGINSFEARPESFFFDIGTGRLWDGTIEQFFTVTDAPLRASTIMAIHLGTPKKPVDNHMLIIRLADDNRYVHYKWDENKVSTGRCTVKR